MDAWEHLLEFSTAPAGSDAWEHLITQIAGDIVIGSPANITFRQSPLALAVSPKFKLVSIQALQPTIRMTLKQNKGLML